MKETYERFANRRAKNILVRAQLLGFKYNPAAYNLIGFNPDDDLDYYDPDYAQLVYDAEDYIIQNVGTEEWVYVEPMYTKHGIAFTYGYHYGLSDGSGDYFDIIDGKRVNNVSNKEKTELALDLLDDYVDENAKVLSFYC